MYTAEKAPMDRQPHRLDKIRSISFRNAAMHKTALDRARAALKYMNQLRLSFGRLHTYPMSQKETSEAEIINAPQISGILAHICAFHRSLCARSQKYVPNKSAPLAVNLSHNFNRFGE